MLYLFIPHYQHPPTEMDHSSVSSEVVEKKSGSISDNGTTNDENASKPKVQQTSTHYDPKLITSLDCKILQYQYNIYKLQKSISHIRKLQTECQSSPNLPLLHYIVLLVGCTFSINDKAFDAKLDILSNFHLFRNTTINITAATSHIPYDTPDLPITPLNDIPEVSTSIKCLKQLESLCNTCLQGYKKKLEQAKVEKSNEVGNIDTIDAYYSTIEKIISSVIFNNDIDLVFSDSTFTLPIDNVELMANENFQEATLIDMDIKELFIIVKQIERLLNFLKSTIVKLKQPQCADPYALHKIFLITQRLNDIYTIVRRYGRKIYLSNYQHLTDSKFLFHCKNPQFFKNNILKDMNDFFNSMKKNGTLIANLTRFVRQDSRFETNSKNITNNMNFTNQGLLTVETTLTKLKEFGMSWIVSELKFRRVYQLPKKNLFDIYQSVPDFKQRTNAAALITGPNTLLATATTSANKSKTENSTPNGGQPVKKTLDKLETNNEGTKSRSRSSSVSSITSNGSSSGLMRRGSISSPAKPSPLSLSQNGRNSPRTSRPNSMLFLNPNSSTSNLESDPEKKSSAPLSPSTGAGTIARRRSNSQPIGRDAIIATSGAATALSRNSSLSSHTSPLRSPSTNNNMTAVPTEKASSPTPSKITQKLLMVQEEETPSLAQKSASAATKLSASQRFQQRVREAAKNGDLVTQKKETFTSVTFDPNDTSKLSIRKYSDIPTSPDIEAESKEEEPEKEKVAVAPQRRTRDQVTRHNTQRNSHIPIPKNTDTKSSSSSIDQSSGSNNSTGSVSNSTSTTTTTTATISKKVRFTGVPEWTEAEDAPTKYSHAILRNFAVFRHPIKTAKAHNSKSDQLLHEESISFKTSTVVVNDNEVTIAPKPKSGFSRIKSRLI